MRIEAQTERFDGQLLVNAHQPEMWIREHSK
jgi:hypothetical protein